MRLTILHTNDIHGRQERIAQIATIVRRRKDESPHRVLYLDAGDVEETTNHLSSVTKGTAMHRLLSLTSCDAHTVGNACWLRYGPGVLAEHARAASYPLLLANFTGIEGPVPSVLLDGVGVFGLTAPFQGMADDVDWGFERADILETAKECARDLRARGAEIVVLLSHLGLDAPNEPWDDRSLAPELRGLVDVVIGAHTHDLFPDGEVIGGVLVAQAGSFGDHVGRIEIDGDLIGAVVESLPDDTPADPAIAEEAAAIEREVEEMLAEPIGEVDVPLDAEFIARMLRERMNAEVGLFSEGQTLGVLRPGKLTRGMLWRVSDSPANPGVTWMTGAQLSDLIARGNAPEMQSEMPQPLRGRRRGRLVVAGPAELDPDRRYVVAGTDWELEPYGGYALPQWKLPVTYDFPTIVREAVEEHLRGS
jgi:2',3'-cyclic-nucleotide 2'-phosphodiesterase (5'-nucleotidase family)